jgi:DNA-binding ferritin-like protein (Dps family)
MLNKIFSTLKLWKQEKIDYKVYKKRIQKMPKDYQIVFKEIEAFMWNFASGDGRGMVGVLTDILELFESGAQGGKNVLKIVGEDVSDFCDGILKEVQAQTWTGKKKDMLNQTIYRKLGGQKY